MVFFLVHLAARCLLRVLGGSSSVAALEVENAVLRHQLAVLRRTVKRPPLRRRDDDSLTVAEVAAQHGAANALVFVDDGEEPADPELTLAVAGAGDDSHLHLARCPRVTAIVHFKEGTEQREFPPNVVITAVYQWAAGPNGFKLSATDKAEHMLGITGTDTAADEDAHLAPCFREKNVPTTCWGRATTFAPPRT